MPKSCDRPAYSVALAINSAKMTAKKCIMKFKSGTRTPSDIACDSAENLPLGAEKMAYRTRLGPACQKRGSALASNPHFTSQLRDDNKVSSTISQLYLAPWPKPQKRIWGKTFSLLDKLEKRHWGKLKWGNAKGVRGAKQRVLCTGNFWPGLRLSTAGGEVQQSWRVPKGRGAAKQRQKFRRHARVGLFLAVIKRAKQMKELVKKQLGNCQIDGSTLT